MKLHQIDAIIFDLDGTIVDSEYAYYLGWRHAFQQFNVPIEDAIIKTWSGLSAKDTGHIINQVTKKPELLPLLRKHRQEYFFELLDAGQVSAKPSLYEFLDRLELENKKMALATSTYEDRGQPILDALNINHYFSVKYFGNNVEHLKPSPDIYLKTLQSLSVKPERALVIEDSPSGIMAAQNAGIPVAVIPDASLMENNKINYQNVFGVFETFKELQEYLEK